MTTAFDRVLFAARSSLLGFARARAEFFGVGPFADDDALLTWFRAIRFDGAGDDVEHYARTCLAFAAIGDDGRRPVVWGVGATEAEALADARSHVEDGLSTGDPGVAREMAGMRVVTITAERRAAILAGAIDASDLAA